MSSLFGLEASRAVQYVVAFAIILVLVALFGLVLRKLTGGRLMMPGHDRGRSRQPRLGVVDIYDLDRQRQLILLRRDNVEHLLLIGGPNDVVIETNIVRVAGARIPSSPSEAAPERIEPQLEHAPRPQVEPSGRPSIETQLAAQLGAFVKRPSDESDMDEELAPIGTLAGAAPARPEPVLKPDHVAANVTPMQPLRPAPEPEPRPEPVLRPEPEPQAQPQPRPQPVPVPPQPQRASFLRAPATPAPVVRPEQRAGFAPAPFQSRPTPTPPAPPPPAEAPAPAPEIVRAPQPTPAAAESPDAAILSDMARQLEEALKRPGQPPGPTPTADRPRPVAPDLDEDELLVPETEEDENETTVRTVQPAAYEESDEEEEAETKPEPAPVEPPQSVVEPVRPAPEPPRPAPAEKAPESPAPAPAAPPAPPTAPQSAAKAPDPFSVEDIEAEFARLLGRPKDTGNKG